MLRGSVRPAVANTLRVGGILRSVERGLRGVATAPGDKEDRHDSGISKPLPSRETPQGQKNEISKKGKSSTSGQEIRGQIQQKKKTMAELDEELKLKLEGVSGEGGHAGVEYEGGKAVGLKRGVKENMFRVI